jgi:hypothetical protein
VCATIPAQTFSLVSAKLQNLFKLEEAFIVGVKITNNLFFKD